MTEYEIQASTRRCAATGRDLRPGERYYSVLLAEGSSLVRKDYSPEAWQGPPPGAFGFWQGRLSGERGGPRRPTFDDELLLECFQRLAPEEGQQQAPHAGFRFVLALLLMRRRRLRLEDTRREGGQEVMVVRCARTGERHLVVDPGLSDDQLEAVQEDVFRVLGWE